MKKLIKFLLASSMLLCGFITTASAATVRDDNTSPSSRAYYDPCDQIFRVGEYGIFGIPNTDGALHFTVNQVDAAGDKIYCNELGAWLPAYPLTKIDSSGYPSANQVLGVGDKFTITKSPDGLVFNGNKRPDIFKIYNVDAPSDSVQIHLMDKWGKVNAVWVYAKPMYEFNPNGMC